LKPVEPPKAKGDKADKAKGAKKQGARDGEAK
jgi:hypothetical protein